MTVAVSTPLARGTQLGRYVIDDALGTGANATVYRVRDIETDQAVALKRASAPGNDARWEIEARLLAAAIPGWRRSSTISRSRPASTTS